MLFTRLFIGAVVGTGLLLDLARAAGPGPLAAAMQPSVDAHTLAGAVMLVATPDTVLDVETAGFADIDAKRAMQPDAMFWIASMTKPMTATVLMMLVDEGKVSLDDPVEKYLPAFHGMMVQERAAPGAPAPAPVPATHPFTIRECLWHGAGLRFTSQLERPTLDVHTLEERVDSYAKEPLQSQPGTSSKYANEGPNIVGRIIEVVSGEPYEKFLQERLLTPLGMTDTTFWPTAEQGARLAVSYKASPDGKGLVASTVTQLKYPLDGPGRYPMPAGGLFSTARDVGTFCQMIASHGVWQGHQYLSEKSWEEMKTRQSPPDDKQAVGVVWRLAPGAISHGGAYQTNMRIDLAKNFITVFMVQQNGPWPNGAKNQDAIFEQAARQAFLAAASTKPSGLEQADPSRTLPPGAH